MPPNPKGWSSSLGFFRFGRLEMANSWFRMYSEFATDPKVQMLSEAYQRRLTMLFCLRCNGNVTLHDSEVTFMLRISETEWQETKSVFILKGFINKDNEILNWDKRQYVSDSSAERVARHRAKKKDDVTSCNVTVTPPDTEQIQNRTDTDTEKTLTPLAMLTALGVSKKSAQDWLKIRKTKKLVLTDDAYELLKAEIEKSGLSAADVIKKCNENSWGGFKAVWLENKSGSNKFIQQDNELAEYNKHTSKLAKERLFGNQQEKDITNETERL